MTCRRCRTAWQRSWRLERLEPRELLAGDVVISEFMASNDVTLLDDDGNSSDWLELHNLSGSSVSLENWYLTDDDNVPDKWKFPDVVLEPDAYLVVFASDKDRAPADAPLHTNFKLGAGGEYLGLIRPDLTVEHAYAPEFPPQIQDVAYGLPEGGSFPSFLATATPGEPNSPARSSRVTFNRESGVFTDPFSLVLSVGMPDARIYFTSDGTEPTELSTEYSAPIGIASTTLVQAIAVAPDSLASTLSSRWFVKMDDSLAGVDSHLPIVVLDNFGVGSVPGTTTRILQFHGMAIFEPDDATGRTTLQSEPELVTRTGIRERGSSGADGPKKSLAVEAWDENNRDTDIAPLGLPPESDWILYAPLQFDRALIQNPLIYELSNQLGRYAVRTRFVELYHNVDGGDVAAEDYVGVYVLMEKIKVGPDRVDISELRPEDNLEPEVSGGWLLKIDRVDPNELFLNDTGVPIHYVEPQAEDVTPAQADWILNFVNELYASLSDTDPETGYAQYIDVDSWIDHHILNVLAQNPDAFRYSAFFHKDRGGKLQMGPIWDFDRTMGSTVSQDDDPYRWEGASDATNFFYFGGAGQPKWWSRLFQDPNFMQRWIDRWFALRETVFANENIDRVIDSMADELAEAADRNFARWSEFGPRASDEGHFPSGQLDGTFQGEIEHTRKWLRERMAWIDSQFLEPPRITPDAPRLDAGRQIEIASTTGTVYFTRDGSDPRLPGGAMHPAAEAYNPEVTFVSTDAPARYRVPTGGAGEAGWQQPLFDDASWDPGQRSVGFDTGIVDLPIVVRDGFEVYQAHSESEITSLAPADRLLSGFGVVSEAQRSGIATINYSDGHDEGNFGGSVMFPDGAGQDFALQATATLVVHEAGDYTFGVRTDDGSRLIVDGRLVIVDSITGPPDKVGSIFLEQGEHSLELVMYQHGEDAEAELFVAPGERAAFGKEFLLLGDVDSTDFTPLIAADVESQMHGTSSSFFVRIPFDAPEAESIERLFLDIQYDDGFVAYLNGTEVARRNAPGQLAHDSAAVSEQLDARAVHNERIDISSYQSLVRTAGNVLAIHGLNASSADPDFLLVPQIAASVIVDPIVFDQPVHLTSRVMLDGQWSAPAEARFFGKGGPDDASQLAITEINYNPHPPTEAELAVDPGFNNDDFEFIEINNRGGHAVELAGIRFTGGIEFTFAEEQGGLLDPGEFVLIVQNRAAFEARYGSERPVAGEYSGRRLSNDGEQLRLEDRFGLIVHDFVFKNSDTWPRRADGLGSALEIVDPDGDDNNGSNWRASVQYGGSPGRAPGKAPPAVVINEVLAGGNEPHGDRMELHNLTAQTIDIGGWYFSDNLEDPFQYAIPLDTTLSGKEFLVLDETELGFALDAARGGELWLISVDRTTPIPTIMFADRAEFGAAEPSVSLGRWPDRGGDDVLFSMVSQTFGSANSGPRFGPAVLSEVHFNPAELPAFREDFQDGMADGFFPDSGTWEVVEGQYLVTPGTEQPDDTVTLVPSLSVLSGRFSIGASVRTDSSSPFKKNVAIIFDYKTDRDFKFVSIHANANKLRMGHRDADQWNFLAETQPSPPLELDTELEVSVNIAGTQAALTVNGQQLLQFDFGQPLNEGQVGLGSKGGQALFDNVVVTPGDDEAFEFIEVLNTTSDPLDLTGWRLNGAVDVTLPAGTVLPADGLLVAVNFDPSDPVATEEFRTLYGIDASVSLVGPYAGRLNNTSGTLALSRPQQPLEPTSGLILVDRARYEANAPWPTAANGFGPSLSRRAMDAFGTVATSWLAQAPSPGSVSFVRSGDLNGDGQLDADDLESFALALRDAKRYEALFGRSPVPGGDVDSDGDLDFDDIDELVSLIASSVSEQLSSTIGAGDEARGLAYADGDPGHAPGVSKLSKRTVKRSRE